MSTRKIVIATPIKLGLTSSYMAGFVPTIQTKFPGIELEHCILEGPAINFARNECAHYAQKIGAREIVFIDDDMGWNPQQFARLISHVDLDIVGLLYCKRRPGLPQYLVNLKEGCDPDPVTGLCEVNDMPTGFLKIRVDTVLPAIEKKYPEKEFYNKPDEGKPVTSFEYFPMGIFGPRTAESRLAEIDSFLKNRHTYAGDDHEHLRCIENLIAAKHEPGTLRGEDYGFCELARTCGFKIYADFGGPIVPHLGKVQFPITPDMVGLDPTAALRAAGEDV